MKSLSLRLSMMTVFFSISTFAADWKTCRIEAENHGNGDGPSYIDKECVTLANDMNNPKKKASHSKDDVVTSIIGFENMIIIIDESPDLQTMSKLGDLPIFVKTKINRFIAGPATKINQIESLKFDASTKEITIVDSVSRETLIFDYEVSGNISPEKIIVPSK